MQHNSYRNISKHLEPLNIARLKATSKNAANAIPKITETELVDSMIKHCVSGLRWSLGSEEWDVEEIFDYRVINASLIENGIDGIMLRSACLRNMMKSPVNAFPNVHVNCEMYVHFHAHTGNVIIRILNVELKQEQHEEHNAVNITYDSSTGNLTFSVGEINEENPIPNPYPHNRYIYKWFQAIYESARNALPAFYPIQITQNGGKYKKPRLRKSQK